MGLINKDGYQPVVVVVTGEKSEKNGLMSSIISDAWKKAEEIKKEKER